VDSFRLSRIPHISHLRGADHKRGCTSTLLLFAMWNTSDSVMDTPLEVLLRIFVLFSVQIKGLFGKPNSNPYSRGSTLQNCCFLLCGPIPPSLIGTTRTQVQYYYNWVHVVPFQLIPFGGNREYGHGPVIIVFRSEGTSNFGLSARVAETIRSESDSATSSLHSAK